ncbi:hypothetical protein [Paraliomyxa miuraensis]|uniref:hypothetical protein n=1 Tax=Paraliomyxa miuraensis TaxID=376150 RepID=UPI0022556398|nr:hypothetical protein [Paraliomyxa miuraensis]MCX4241351.1 hypothetical protein [Paraliomyxa miuraensis]
MRIASLVFVVLLAACPGTPSEESSGSSETSETTEPITTSTSSSGVTSTTDATTVGSADETSSGTGIDPTAGSVCEPQPEDLTFYVSISPYEPPEGTFFLTIDAACVVQGVTDEGDVRTFALECDEDGMMVPHDLEVVHGNGPLDLPMTVGTPIHLRVAKDFPIDYGGFTYIVVRSETDELLLGYYGGGEIPPMLGVDVDPWFAPLTYALAFGDCDPEPYEEPGMFIQEPCPAQLTRLAVDFLIGDDGIHLLDRTSGQLGPWSLFVLGARHLDPQMGSCDLPIDAFAFVAYQPG